MFTLNFSGFADQARLCSVPGAVVFNGRELKPHEARVLAARLVDLAEHAALMADVLDLRCNSAAAEALAAERHKLTAPIGGAA